MTMQHYKDKENRIHALDLPSQADYVNPEWTAITIEERDAILNPPLTRDQKIAAIRVAIENQITEVAQSAGPFGFTSEVTAVSYRGGDPTSINVIYGTAVFEYREAVWNEAAALVQAFPSEPSDSPEPTIEQILGMLPQWADYNPDTKAA